MALARENCSEDEKNLNSMRTVLENSVPDLMQPLLRGFPCGILRCTYEKHPKAIYANEWMFHFMGINEESEDWREFIQQNVFFMIPFEEREIFKRDLIRAAKSEKAVPVEHRIRNCTGGKTCLTGWIRTAELCPGQREFVFLYTPVAETYFSFWGEREAAYETVLKAAYDVIFRIEWRTGILECVYARPEVQLLNLPGARIVLNPAMERGLISLVCQKDQDEVERFFASRREKQIRHKERDSCIRFQLTHTGTLHETMVVGVDLDDQTTLFCCKEIQAQLSAEESVGSVEASENSTNGELPVKTVVYKLSRARVYLQNSVGGCFSEPGVLINEFLTGQKISEEEYWTAIREGRAELNARDPETGGRRVLYGVRKSGMLEKSEECMLLLYIFRAENTVNSRPKPRVTIRTFGYFDVLVDGKPIIFRNEKSKEMLAVLVDRKGSFVSNPYFISCLWGTSPTARKSGADADRRPSA